MAREDVEFKTFDNVTLRAWFYKPVDTAGTQKLPCLLMAHGFTALKEMDLDAFAEYFVSKLSLSCLVYDQRGFGDSDARDGHPRHEIIPSVQCSDLSDAITYAQSREDVNPDRIGIWGSSYSGGNALWVGAVDRRVKVVLCQVPCVNGWENFHRMIRADFVAGMDAMFQADRLGRHAGKTAITIPVVDPDPMKPSAIPSQDSYAFFSAWGKKSNWKNEVTLKSIEAFREFYHSAHIHHISPTPLLMTVADNDVVTPTDLALEAYSRAREPKQLHILHGGHFDGYSGPLFEKNVEVQTDFLRRTLCIQ